MAKLVHERFKCISCGACAAVAPTHWEMMADTKSSIKVEHKNFENSDGEMEEAHITDDEVPTNGDAEQVCPVNCIHVKE